VNAFEPDGTTGPFSGRSPPAAVPGSLGLVAPEPPVDDGRRGRSRRSTVSTTLSVIALLAVAIGQKLYFRGRPDH